MSSSIRILPFVGRRRENPYDRAFAGAWRSLSRRAPVLAAERAAADALLAEVLAQPAARCRLILRNRRSACTWSLCQRLIAAAEERLAGDPRRAQELAALAAEVVERLDAGRYGRPLIADLAAHAWGTVGEALRRRRRRCAAEAALAAAANRLADGSAEPLEEALLLERAGGAGGRPRPVAGGDSDAPAGGGAAGERRRRVRRARRRGG